MALRHCTITVHKKCGHIAVKPNTADLIDTIKVEHWDCKDPIYADSPSTKYRKKRKWDLHQ